MKHLQQSIVMIADTWQHSWNEHDFSLMKNYITKNASWISLSDDHLYGRNEILKHHIKLHKDQLRFAKWRYTNLSYKKNAPGVYTTHINWLIEELNDSDEVISLRKGSYIWVLVKEFDQLLISACQTKGD